MMSFKISVVIPAFNEAGTIRHLCEELQKILAPYADYELLFVDDGSTDGTLLLLQQLHQENCRIRYISLSRNFGHQLALKAGLDRADGDCVISMDADMQHPPSLIPEMIAKWMEGYEIVYTRRRIDPQLSFFKRKTSSLFYKLTNFLSDIKIEEGAADFRLLDRQVVDTIRKFNEPHLFLRGLVSWMGYRQYGISYSPNERFSGKTKYSLKKMVIFALNGITSFSVRPLKISVVIGFFISLLAMVYGLYAIYEALFTNNVVSGWTSLLVTISFIGGLQLMMMGIIGIYLGQVFMQTKNRPNYIIKEQV
jgi:dolichol-phosphate mannosyltransferase